VRPARLLDAGYIDVNEVSISRIQSDSVQGAQRSASKGRNIMGSIHDLFRNQGLVRQRDGRLLGGVCAGIGRKVGLDPWPTRLLFVLLLLVLPGCQLLIYPILWLLMPMAENNDTVATSTPAQP
jgi:phage shock protein PspC (stress-responsive transcriptional regulator)